MRSLVLLFCLVFVLVPVHARADRATIEVAGGIGDATRTLIRQSVEFAETETTLLRVRGRLTIPLSPDFAAIFSYERLRDGSSRLAYVESNGTRVVSRERVGFFEIGFRLGL